MQDTGIFESSELKKEKISDTLYIYQQSGVFSYGTDAVLLSAYAADKMLFSSSRTLFDLCSGTGIIGLTLLDLFRSKNALSVTGIEINKTACNISEMSAAESSLSDFFTVNCCDIKDVPKIFPADIADYITVNPPYMTSNCGFACTDDYKNIARHEILCKLEDIFASAFHLLKSGGSMFIVYRPERLSTLFDAAKRCRFEIKQMTFVHSVQGKESRLVLCRAQKNAKEGLIISRPFIMQNKDGSYTQDYMNVRDKGVMTLE